MFRRLMVPLDGSSLAEQAIGQAVAIARTCQASIELVGVVVPDLSEDRAPDSGWGLADAYLASVAERIASTVGVRTTHVALTGYPTQRIRQHVSESRPDLVVMTSHGRTGFRRLLMGSVADEVIRGSSSPVLMLRADAAAGEAAALRRFTRILVTLDGSALAFEAVAPASELARIMDAELVLLRVVEPMSMVTFDAVGPAIGTPMLYPPFIADDDATDRARIEAQEQLSTIARSVSGAERVPVETHVVVGRSVSSAIIEFAEGHAVDAIALSTHGRGVSRLIIGSVADQLIRGCRLPLLLQRPVTTAHVSLVTAPARAGRAF